MVFYNYILYFFIYSFTGWFLEAIYASYLEDKFVNRGFLKTPFCPIYGFGSLVIIQIFNVLNGFHLEQTAYLMIGAVLSILVATVFEYMTGYILEKAFHVRWWDYSDEALNVNGHICFKYSLLWGLGAFVIVMGMQPVLTLNFNILSDNFKEFMSIVLIVTLLSDTAKSTDELIDLKKVLETYEMQSLDYYHAKIIDYKRFFVTFPYLLSINNGIRNYDPGRILNEKIEKFKIQFRSRYL